jgi:hypothetical protein
VVILRWGLYLVIWTKLGFYLGFLCSMVLIHSYDSVQQYLVLIHSYDSVQQYLVLIHSYDSVQQYLVRQFIFIAHAHDVRNGNELVVCTLGVILDFWILDDNCYFGFFPIRKRL